MTVFTGTLPSGTTMVRGDTLVSPDGTYTIKVQTDGNIAEYPTVNAAAQTGALWSTGTTDVTTFVMQGDGNLVAYNVSSTARWASGSGGHNGSYATLSNNGTFLVVQSGVANNWFNNNVYQPPSTPITYTGTLPSATDLYRGDTLVSSDGTYTIKLQSGNLVEVAAANPGTILWSSGTSTGYRLSMQSDGNLVLYTSSNTVAWKTDTSGHPGAYAPLGIDASFKVVSAGAGTTTYWTNNVFIAPTTNGRVKVWTGTAFAAKPVKVWTGTAWVQKPVKRWNGAAWVRTTY